jgi:hypothetical protein
MVMDRCGRGHGSKNLSASPTQMLKTNVGNDFNVYFTYSLQLYFVHS